MTTGSGRRRALAFLAGVAVLILALVALGRQRRTVPPPVPFPHVRFPDERVAAPAPPAPDVAAPAEPDLGGMSRAELYERARTLDIPGRSRMKKDELLEAIREATAGR